MIPLDQAKIAEIGRLAADVDPLRASLAMAALIGQRLSERPIIVGDAALRFYTLGGFTCQQIELDCDDNELSELLRLSKFERLNDRWFHNEFDDVIKPISTEPTRSPMTDEARARSYEIEVGKYGKAIIQGPEDLIADLLYSSINCGLISNFHWAVSVATSWHEHIDWAIIDQLTHHDANLKSLAIKVNDRSNSILIEMKT